MALDTAAVERERERLRRENEELRTLLKNFLDGISVNSAVLDNPANPLLVVNNRLQITLAERHKQRTGSAGGLGAGRVQGGSAAKKAPASTAGGQQLLMVNAISAAR